MKCPTRSSLFVFLAASLAVCFCATEGIATERIVIGSKSYNEPIILGEMVAYLARHAGAEATHRAELGGTRIVYNALLKGELDFYFDYTGTLAKEIFSGEEIKDDEQLRAALEKKGVRMGEPLGFNNSYALGMREQRAAELEIQTISDLRRRAAEYPAAARLKFGVSDEFIHRNDGWPGLQARYGLPFVVRGMDHNLAYRGLQSGRLDVTDVYSTDAEVQYYKLRVLEDDLGYFPVYYCVPLYRIDLEKKAPQALAEISKLTGKIDNPAMTAMNARVQIDRASESVVAAEFINAQLGMTVPVPVDNYWQKTGASLVRNTLQHLLLVSVSLAAAILIAVPLGIIAFRRPRIGSIILGVVGIVQTIPSLAVLVFMVPLLGLGALPAITALFLYSLLPIVRNTYQGLKDISGNLRESATVLGLDDYARLRLVELPLASRSILSGIKTAAVINVGAATIGGLIGAGGYGQPIMTGLRLNDTALLLQGAIPAALLAVVIDGFFGYLERFFVPAGLRIKAGA
ncbi:ABC transporter permease/substrate-binding protein [Anatilimnocola floriformis]|uniref:ABC transporter permease/substrate-binding protein n=1 Tax=Anatilimnocola floriformis TaxID=2948575 RepID=UPI0020C1FBF6|nr:glycine betaine ABC transporter substrate-binding protein [Anatilimnocola floriformis]